jgi:hypothetical protein
MNKHPELSLLLSKERHAEDGYPEQSFGDDYWLASDGQSPARIDKSAAQIMRYFDRLFELTGPVDDRMGKGLGICDIGAGAGNMVNEFRQAGYTAHGCEYSESGRRIAEQRFGIKLQPCDLRYRLSYIDNRFEWSYCVGVLSMIPEKDMQNALKEILRVTQYGVLINVYTEMGEMDLEDRMGNRHHLTVMSPARYHKIICTDLGYYDWTSVLPPQKRGIGIGVENEFCGLFSKQRWPF